MRQTFSVITVDPFAYTRSGLPYLSGHEWLAQILFSLVFDSTGPVGVILLRSALVSASVVLILFIERKHIWICAPFAMLAALTLKEGGATDRPHLWTWFLLALFLLICARLLQHPRNPLRTVIALVLLEILWANLHGGAALLGIVVGGALGAQLLFDRWRAGEPLLAWSALPVFLLPVSLGVAFFISPIGTGPVTYIVGLLNDQSTQFVAEWQPRAFLPYIADLWPFWAAALASFTLARKYVPFTAIVLCVLGLLSRMSRRHEMLFTLGATALTFLQLEGSPMFRGGLTWLNDRRRWTVPTVILLMAALVFHARSVNLALANRYHTAGYGIVDQTADVTRFLDQNRLAGPVFNTFNLGSELIAHFYPNRKVFVDGRIVDFGEAFLLRVFSAANDPQEFASLERQYGFTVAIIDTWDWRPGSPAAYVGHLAQNPHWALVFADDWTALYLKDVPANASVIAKDHLRLLTPQNLKTGDGFDNVTDAAAVEKELTQSIADGPSSLNARLLLARYFLGTGRTDRAETTIAKTINGWPDDFRPYEVLGLLRAREGKFDEAESAFDQSLSRLTSEEAVPIRAYVARVFESLGESQRARKYR